MVDRRFGLRARIADVAVALEATLPPPVLMLLLAAAMWAAAQTWPGAVQNWMFADAVALGFAAAGLAANLLPKHAFRRAGTTVNPLRPAATTGLVTTGLHRYSRNPMYVGHVLLLAAWALHLQHPLAMLALPIQVAWLTRFQIVPEERALRARFATRYVAYCRRTPRWW